MNQLQKGCPTRKMNKYHTSVLLQETIENLQVREGKQYIDGTLGGGGHTGEILKRGGRVLGIDMDDDALGFVQENLASEIKAGKLILAKGNFKDIDKIAAEHEFTDVAGILFDLGVSSHHFDTPERGFSVQKMGPLDMRMDRNLAVKAKDLINILTKGELYELFTKLGEEHFARAISDSIVSSRQIKPIETTTELVAIVARSVPKRQGMIHPATKVFQALRIAVNDELNNIREGLPKAVGILKASGRLAVISFHSLEDRIIKNSFLAFQEKGMGTIVTKKPIVPTREEIRNNKRSRSSKLRVFEKL